MRFMPLTHHTPPAALDKTGVRLLLLSIGLGLILLLQVGLVLWIYVQQFRS